MPERVWDEDPTIPPPGRRTGAGSSTILPYLARTLAAKPQHDPGSTEGRPASRVDIELELAADRKALAADR